ncbi:MAG: hypothetical protein KGR26_04230, partial [Cyanobacteria bacterium REEB65]|nr:hypothetical protein [Cyanobacteria bacterium REEB65]
AAIAAGLADRAEALSQSAEHAASRPDLLVDRLVLAAEDVGHARFLTTQLDDTPVVLQAYQPAWIRERLAAADEQLRQAMFDTIDPAELQRIATFRSRDRQLGALADTHRTVLGPRLLQLGRAIWQLADAVEVRVRNRRLFPVPLKRPPLESLDELGEDRVGNG